MMNQLKMFFSSVKENFLGDDKKESQWAVVIVRVPTFFQRKL